VVHSVDLRLNKVSVMIYTHYPKRSIWILSILLTWLSYASHAQELFYEWAHSMDVNGTTFRRLGGHDVVIDAQGNVFVTGNFYGTVDLDPSESTASFTSSGEDDCFLVKYDAHGNYLWGFAIGGSSVDAIYNLAIDANGNVVVAGTFRAIMDLDPSIDGTHIVGQDPASQIGQAFIAKYSSADGALLWGNALEGERSTIIKMIMDASYNIYVMGFMDGTVDFDPSANVANLTHSGAGDPYYIAKYDQDGHYLWANLMAVVSAWDIALDHNQNLYVTGSFTQPFDADPSPASQAMVNLTSGSIDVFLAKYNSTGGYQWAKVLGSTSTNIGYHVITDEYGNAYVHGVYRNSDFVSKYTPDGQSLWLFRLAGTFDTQQNKFCRTIGLAENNSFYISGVIKDDIDFDPSSGVFKLPGGKEDGAFLAQYNYDGQLITVTALPSESTQISAISVNAHHEVLLTGAFEGTLDLDLSQGVADVTSSTGAFFVSKYKTCVSTAQFTGQQFNEAVCVGATTAFEADAGEGTYQWFKNGAQLVRAGTTVDASILELTQAQLEDEGVYHLEFVDACYTKLVSDAMPLHVIAPVTITTSPQDVAVSRGEGFVLQGAAAGEDVIYNWSKDDAPLEDANAATYEVEHAVGMDAGAYFFTASNSCNTVTSATAHVVMLLNEVTGNEESSQSSLSYINPVADRFTFTFDNLPQGLIDVAIYGAQGNLTYYARIRGCQCYRHITMVQGLLLFHCYMWQ
jgi:hypothetical protein